MTIENWADPPLRGYSSMPAMYSIPEVYQLPAFAAALDQVLSAAALQGFLAHTPSNTEAMCPETPGQG